MILYIFIFTFVGSLIMYYIDLSVLFEWLMFSINTFEIELIVLLDWVSVLFVRFVLLISSKVMFYRVRYISNEKLINRFAWLMLGFIISIIMIIIRPNILRILFGWDGLGLVSFCLVIYYQNFISYNSGIVTVLRNRIGDIGILITIRIIIINGSWNIMIFRAKEVELWILLLAIVTKRAQIPFSRWLPIAMAAPTPVSALVHSSTLVTAGVYLIIRFNHYYLDNNVSRWFLYLAVLTIIISGIIANVEIDLKKIIALSTLRQLGLMMMTLSIGFKYIAFYHLLTHAIFKSLLFICAGIIIHSIINNQDIRRLGGIYGGIPMVRVIFLISNFALCGGPFMAGFYSKDIIMEVVYNLKVNIIILLLIILSLIFTVIYSLRLIYYIFWGEVKFYSFINIKEEKRINLFMVLLIVLRIIRGSFLRWLFFFDCYIIYLGLNLKILTLVLCLTGIVFRVVMMNTGLIKRAYYLIYYLRSIWFLNYLYIWIYVPINIFGIKINEIDKIWVEFIIKDWFILLIKYIKIKNFYNINIFIYIYLIYILIIYFIY